MVMRMTLMSSSNTEPSRGSENAVRSNITPISLNGFVVSHQSVGNGSKAHRAPGLPRVCSLSSLYPTYASFSSSWSVWLLSPCSRLAGDEVNRCAAALYDHENCFCWNLRRCFLSHFYLRCILYKESFHEGGTACSNLVYITDTPSYLLNSVWTGWLANECQHVNL